VELDAGGDLGVGAAYIDKAVDLANPIVIGVLTRYPTPQRVAVARESSCGDWTRRCEGCRPAHEQEAQERSSAASLLQARLVV
jgi:hypothetical protein